MWEHLRMRAGKRKENQQQKPYAGAITLSDMESSPDQAAFMPRLCTASVALLPASREGSSKFTASMCYGGYVMCISGRVACVGGYECTYISLPPWAKWKEAVVKNLEKTGCPSKAHETDHFLSICYLQSWEAVLRSVDHTFKWEMSKTGMYSEVRDKDGGRTSGNAYKNV